MTTSLEVGRIGRRFRERAGEGRAVLVPYLTAGFPDEDTSLEALEAMVGAGADVLELGIPFSDPIADGPTIQKASFEALERGMTLRRALGLLERFRARHGTPVVLFTYLNPVLRYGVADFLVAAREAGADGLLLTDLQYGADPEVERAVSESPLDLIRLIAPTTERSRVTEIAGGGSGFVYYISRTGVTGAREELRGELGREVGAVRSAVGLPVAVGFGISTPAQARLVAEIAEGVVVGSALIDALDRGGVAEAGRFMASLRVGMDGEEGAGR